MASTKVTVHCNVCDLPMQRYPSQVARVKHGVHWCPEHRERGRGAKPRATITCETCGKVKPISPCQVGRTRFCSKPCRMTRVERACAWCSGVFLARRGDVGRYCSPEHGNLARMTNAIPGTEHNGRPKKWHDAGYVLIYEPGHPKANKGWVYEHRWVKEQEIGRYLRSEEEIDHRNENKADNRPSNLRIVSKVEHQRITAANARRNRQRERGELVTLRAEVIVLHAEVEEYRRRFGALDGAAHLPQEVEA